MRDSNAGNEILKISYDDSNYDYLLRRPKDILRIGKVDANSGNQLRAEYYENDHALYIYVDGARYTYDQIVEIVRQAKQDF